MAKQPQIQLPPVAFTAAGPNDEVRQANLFNAQQIPGYPDAVLLVADAIGRRVEQVLMDFTRQAVAMKYQIDGQWHDLPPRDRQSGDALLASLKCLAGLNPNERRAAQRGTFQAQFLKVKGPCTLSSQGVPTGERATLEIAGNRPKLERLADLGMRDKMRDRFKELLNGERGMIIVAALPKGGLTTTWTACLNETDRFMRDFAGVQSSEYRDPEILNVDSKVYDTANGESVTALLAKVLLKQPNVLVVPELKDAETLRILCDEASGEERLVITRIQAKSADEALLRVLMLGAPVDKFAEAVRGVLNSRLVRKLCETCRQPYKPAPAMLQKLGIPPGRVEVFYKPFEPPPQPQLDDKGRPIPPPICPQCQGLGYVGRTAIFELLVVTDTIREALKQKPKLEVLRRIVKESGHATLQEEGILLVCKGVTSLAELQRALSQ